MKRRTLLLGIGTVAGTGRVVGSGAFTSVAANRTASVAVADDTDAFLGLGPCSGPNSAYAQEENGLLTLELTDDNPTGEGGAGVNPDATTVLDDVFEITNRGSQSVGVWLDVDPAVDANGDPAIEFYRDGDPSHGIVGQSEAHCLGVGDSTCIGVVIRTDGISVGDDLFAATQGSNGEAMVVNADRSVACTAGGGDVASTRLSTGVADWDVVAVPSAARTPRSTPYDASVVRTPPRAWATSSRDAEWIDPLSTGGSGTDPAGNYAYELTFDGPGTLVIEEFGSDSPVEFFLDERRIGGSSGTNAFGSLEPGSSIPDRSVGSGSHTLRAGVTKTRDTSDTPTGLLIAARLDT